MKTKIILTFSFLLLSCTFQLSAQTFSEWFRQKKTQRKYLLEQIIKLQMYLENLKKGYHIASGGLTLISKIKNGDFQLHHLFFNDLSTIRPFIWDYSYTQKIKENIQDIHIKVHRFKRWIQQEPKLSTNEKIFLEKQLNNLLEQVVQDAIYFNETLRNSSLQMSDQQRLERINYIYHSVSIKLSWLYNLETKSHLLSIQRKREIENLQQIQAQY